MENLNLIIAENLVQLRKRNKLTQLELAEKLNYSDKAVSKWEQGESLPGIEVLYKLSRIYGVSLDYLVGQAEKTYKASAPRNKRRIIITLLSVLAVWFAATAVYTFLIIAAVKPYWLIFCWAVPLSLTVALVFDVLWHGKKFLFCIISLLMWSVLVCFCLQFMSYNIWILLVVGLPLQAAVLLWKYLVK